ncbi:hypothetical protein Tco_0832568, partial [Tanacetum coccineum]
RRAADHNRKLNVVDHNQSVIRSLKSVHTKTPQAKHSVNHTKKVWKATRNHNVNTTKSAWRPTRKVVGSVKPQWKPTGRYFALTLKLRAGKPVGRSVIEDLSDHRCSYSYMYGNRLHHVSQNKELTTPRARKRLLVKENQSRS